MRLPAHARSLTPPFCASVDLNIHDVQFLALRVRRVLPLPATAATSIRTGPLACPFLISPHALAPTTDYSESYEKDGH